MQFEDQDFVWSMTESHKITIRMLHSQCGSQNPSATDLTIRILCSQDLSTVDLTSESCAGDGCQDLPTGDSAGCQDLPTADSAGCWDLCTVVQQAVGISIQVIQQAVRISLQPIQQAVRIFLQLVQQSVWLCK